MAKTAKPKTTKQVDAIKHLEAKRKNIPTAELQSAAQRAEEINPVKPVIYKRKSPLAKGETRQRDADLDPQIVWKGARIRLNEDQITEIVKSGFIDIDDAQIVWRGKDQQDWSDLVVHAPPLYIQEKIHPKAIIDDLMRQSEKRRDKEDGMFDLFHDFNGIDPEAKTEFYEHDQNWSNRMILGDSLQVMASIAEREGLRGQVQCIYFDPPYGIKFNSNWQVSTRSRDVKDGKLDEITREPEQVKAFRDTWKDGIHSYMTYMRDRLTVMRDLLTDNGSIFVQIGDENVHRVRALLDEVFGEENFVSLITVKKTGGLGTSGLKNVSDFVIWFAKDAKIFKFRKAYLPKNETEIDKSFTTVINEYGETRTFSGDHSEIKKGEKLIRTQDLNSSGLTPTCVFDAEYQGKTFKPVSGRSWKTNKNGMEVLKKAGRLFAPAKTLRFLIDYSDYPIAEVSNIWTDFGGPSNLLYVVQTSERIVQRCMLMATDPGDLVLDPTCGSGTTATVAEQWGRRWITIDTSRVALALARARLMGSRYPYYYLADSKDGIQKESEISGKISVNASCQNDVRQGFVYERAPHITLKSIANNSEIEVIWDNYQTKMEPLRDRINKALSKSWNEWDMPVSLDDIVGADGGFQKAVAEIPRSELLALHKEWWKFKIDRQNEIDLSIKQKGDVEFLYDKPYEDRNRVRVAGPFTVESLSPHRVVPADEQEFVDNIDASDGKKKRKPVGTPHQDFTQMIMEHLKSSGVHQAAKDDKISFTTITGWPGVYVAAEGQFMEGNKDKRAAIFIGPEFGTVSRGDLTAAAREALDARFDALIACGFNFEAHTSELNKLGPLPILKAKMNPDLHMSEELKNTGAGNLFIVFGEPDIEWNFDKDGKIVVEVLGVDVFDPKTGDVRASGKDDIAAWFIDTDYNEESFFVRHAYFLGAQDPYKSLKASLRAEIDETAWETLYRDKSRSFARPENGRFAVKVINHFGDEVMKVFAV